MVRDRRATLEARVHGNVPDLHEAFFGGSIILDLPEQDHVKRCSLEVHVREMAEYLRTQRSKHLFELVVGSEDSVPEVRYLYSLGEAAGLFELVLHRGKVKAVFHPRERRVRTKYFPPSDRQMSTPAEYSALATFSRPSKPISRILPGASSPLIRCRASSVS